MLDIVQLYQAHWEAELLFRELKLRFGLDKIKMTDGYITRAPVIMAMISLMMSRVVVDESRSFEVRQREGEVVTNADSSASRPPRRRRSLAVERHGHLIQLYLMIELGYKLPDLDELLLWAPCNPNPHRRRPREQAERGELGSDHY